MAKYTRDEVKALIRDNPGARLLVDNDDWILFAAATRNQEYGEQLCSGWHDTTDCFMPEDLAILLAEMVGLQADRC